MDEFWSPDKLLLMIGFFQFGLILMMFMILSMGKHKHKHKNKGKGKDKVNKNKINTSDAGIEAGSKPANNDINLEPTLPELINQPLPTPPESIAIDSTQSNPPEIDLTYKIDISPELLTELLEISNNPAAIIDEAIRWWLRRRTIDDLDSGMRDRRYPVGLRSHDSSRSQKDLWND